MLKPYVYVACEKVILDQQSAGVASLIGLFSKIVGLVPPNTEIPPNAATPKDWTVFSIWDIEPGDEHKNYVLCTQILYPDQSQFGDVSKQPMPLQPNKRVQMIVRLNGFPIGQLGFYTVRTWLEEEDKKVSDPIEFKLELEFTVAPNPSSSIQ
jgi:hypothetical protein